MASCLPASSPSPSPSPSVAATAAVAQISSSSSKPPSKLSFRLSPRPRLLFSSKSSRINYNHSTVTRVQLNKVSVDGNPNIAAASIKKSEIHASEEKDATPASEPLQEVPASEESISEFMTQVASLVKLVDSRDIVELQLKQLNCELIIRKKEALPQPTVQAPIVMHSPSLLAPLPSHYQPAQPPSPRPAPASSAPSSPVSPAPAAAKSPKSSLPPLKCPMAGTFYRSSAPGEPPFVKVGDKVKKGQVLCIIEAMKLMNEIEADQSGTIVEILVDDGKSVSVDMPLFVIEP